MGIMYWISTGIGLAAAVAGWHYLHRPNTDWRSLEQRLEDQVTASATLAQECARTATSFGGLSTVL